MITPGGWSFVRYSLADIVLTSPALRRSWGLVSDRGIDLYGRLNERDGASYGPVPVVLTDLFTSAIRSRLQCKDQWLTAGMWAEIYLQL